MGLQEWLCTEGFLSLTFPLPQIILPFSENTRPNRHTFSLGLTLTRLKIIKTQQSLHFLIILTLKFSRCYTAFNALSLIIPANFLMNSCCQPWVLAALVLDALHQSPFSASSKRLQTDVQEMGMLLLFSRWVVLPCS